MSAIITSRQEVIGANGVINLANGNFFFLLSVTVGTIQIRLVKTGGGVEEFSGLQAGLKVARLKRWEYATITGTPGATVVFFHGFGDVKEDETSFQQQIATIAGTVGVAVLPASTFTDTPDTAQAINTQTVIVANLARRRITIGVTAASTENVRVSSAGGAGRGIQIQPGTFVEFDNTASLTVRNNNDNATGGNASWYAEEE